MIYFAQVIIITQKIRNRFLPNMLKGRIKNAKNFLYSSFLCLQHKQLLFASDVKVGGSGAKKACDTRCDSFMERTSGAQNSTATSACSFTDIDCAAKKCMYNKDGFCSASAVNVSGTGACCSDQTECETFHK